MEEFTQILKSGRVANIGIGELAISKSPFERLITYSLGSCAGISFFDPQVKVGGLIHCQLPTSAKDPERAKSHPGLYVDTGMSLLIQELFNLGANRKNLICKIAGCGTFNENDSLFKVGEKNLTMTKKVLWKNSILIKGEYVGGSDPKTMILDMSTGKTYIKLIQEIKEL